MHNQFLKRHRTQIWTRKSPEYNHIDIEKLTKHYDHMGKFLGIWTATLISYYASDIQRLLDLKELETIEVVQVNQGRRDLQSNGEVIITLKKCKPVEGWFDKPVQHIRDVNDNDEIVPYRLTVVCEVEHDLSSLIYYKETHAT